MHAHQLYALRRPPKAEIDENLFQRRRANRPSSAKQNQTPALKKQQRPSSATRGQDPANLNRVPSHYEPDPAVLARLKPRSIALEKERLYEDALSLKMEMNLVKEENLKLRTKIQQMEKERAKREETLEESRARDHYFGKGLQSQHLVSSLKQAIKDLKSELSAKDEELNVLRKNLKSTRVAEIEIEVQAYIDECTRLRHHLEEVMSTGMNPAIATYEQRIREQEEQIDLFGRENSELKAALQSSQNELQKWRERIVGGKKKPKRKGEVQHLKSELQKLRAQLDARDKKQSHAAEITPKRKEHPQRVSKGVQNADIPLKPEEKTSSERQVDKPRDLHTVQDSGKNVRFPEDRGRHPDLVLESFFSKVTKMLLERKLSLAVLLAYIYRSDTGFCTAGELYTGLQAQGMAVDREEVEIVIRTLGDSSRLSSSQFQSAYKRFEDAKKSFSGYDDSSHGSSSRPNEPASNPAEPTSVPVAELKPPQEKQKEAPSPVPVQPPAEVQKVTMGQAKPLLRHMSFRMQLQRVPKSRLFQTVFGSPFEKDSTVTLKELCDYLSHPPMSLPKEEGRLMARFLLEPSGPPSMIKEADVADLRGVAKEIIARLSASLDDWPVFTSEDEARFDREIAQAFQRNKLAIKESCKSYDLSKTGSIALSELLEIIRNLELPLDGEVVHYMTLLFYSHQQELDTVPYKEFIKAYTEQPVKQSEVAEKKRADSEPELREAEFRAAEDEGDSYGDDQEYEDDQEEDDSLSENERAQIVRSYLEKIATFLKANRRSPAEFFEPEDGYVYPEGLISALRQLPGVDLQKKDLMVFLEGLQAEEMDELCIAMDYLEKLLAHYGVQQGGSSRSSSVLPSADSPAHEKRVSLLDHDPPYPKPRAEDADSPPKGKSPPKSAKKPKKSSSSSSKKSSSRDYEEEQFDEEEEQLEATLSPEVLSQYLQKYGGRIGNLLRAKDTSLQTWLGKRKKLHKGEFLSVCEEIVSNESERKEVESLFGALQDDGEVEVEDLEELLANYIKGFYGR